MNLVPSQHAKLVKVCAVSPRNTTRLLTKTHIECFSQEGSRGVMFIFSIRIQRGFSRVEWRGSASVESR
ncbi:MAG: hypothetical protein ACTSUT_13660 [Promethearchaeota archaeon]